MRLRQRKKPLIMLSFHLALREGRLATLIRKNRERIWRSESLRKRRMDRKLYQALARETGRSLAWGILTGVRPTKIAMGKREAGNGAKRAFLTWFEEDLSGKSAEKARLAYEIAGREKALLERLDYQDGYSLYVGIPFCPSCLYLLFFQLRLAWNSGADYVEPYLDGPLQGAGMDRSRACRGKS